MALAQMPALAAPRSSGEQAARPADAKPEMAMALLKKNRDVMFSLRSYRAQCQMVCKNFNSENGAPPLCYQLSVLTAAKPNLMRYEMWETAGSKPTGEPDFAIVSDGKKKWTQSHLSYRVENSDPKTFETIMEPWDGFYIGEGTLYEKTRSLKQQKSDITVRYLGREKLDGVFCDKVETDLKEQHGGKSTQTQMIVYLRPDGLVRRQVLTESDSRSVSVIITNLFRIEKNPDLRRQSYAYTPPKGAHPFTPPSEGPEATSHDTLLANGRSAPDFVAKDKHGKEIRLSDLKGKVVVLDFWASWCFPCVSSMPHTQSVVAKLQKEGLPVIVLAVDDEEKAEAFSVWVTKQGAQYPAIDFLYSPQEAFVSSKLFKVTGIPTQYIIDATGTIRASFIGYGGETDALEKAVRAVLASK